MKHKSICGVILGVVLLAVSSVAAASEPGDSNVSVFQETDIFNWSCLNSTPIHSVCKSEQNIDQRVTYKDIYTQHDLTFAEYYFISVPAEQIRAFKAKNAKVFEGVQALLLEYSKRGRELDLYNARF
jgi:hypothetical protein